MPDPTPVIDVAEEAPPARNHFLPRVAGLAAALILRLIGITLRVTISIEEGGPPTPQVPGTIYSFWHRCMLPAGWIFRGRNVVVMISQSKDGEYIARTVERLGFVPVRGSSSRGGVRALLEMRRLVETGYAVVFPIDGPRGPKYVVKPGPVVLARSTERPMVAFHLAVEHAWILNTWDDFMIPQPFSRVHVRLSRYMWVPANADESAMQRHQQELQDALDRVRIFAEENVRK